MTLPRIFIFGSLGLASLIPLDASATETFCAVIERTDDGFVTVREGPAANYSARGMLVPSDQLWMDTRHCRSDFGREFCDEKGAWLFVERVFPNGDPSRSKIKGWVNSHFIRQIGCTND